VVVAVAVFALASLAWGLLRAGGGDRTVSPGAAPDAAASSEGNVAASDGAKSSQRTAVVEHGDGLVRVVGRVVGAGGGPIERALVGDANTERPVATAADGRFELFADRGNRQVTLLVLASGYAPGIVRHDLDPGAPILDLGDVDVVRGGSVRGKVTDRLGNAVAGAAVTLQPVSANAWPASLDLAQLLPPSTTREDGSYTFATLTPGRYRVTASAAGSQDAHSAPLSVIDGNVVDVEPLVLLAGYELSGIVLGPNDAPAGGAHVRVRTRQGGARYDGHDVTKDDGRFAFGGLPPGPLEVEATQSGFLGCRLADVDPTRGAELVLRLEPGLRVAGTVVDARSSRPVEEFAASIRRVGEVDPAQNGSMVQQLERRIAGLRAADPAADAEARERQARIVMELEARLRRLEGRREALPVAGPAGVGPVTMHAEGRFAFEGLEEGLYSIGIASPRHAFALVDAIEVRRGTAVPEVRVRLVAGLALTGTVASKHDGTPVADARVDLVRVLEAPPEEREHQRSLYPWVFARPGPAGVRVMSAHTGADGRFAFANAAPGPYVLSVRHPAMADHDTMPFQLDGDQNLRLAVGARAHLRGRVLDVAAGEGAGVEVFVLGGHGTLRTEKARPDGTFGFDGLQPGSYLVRAFPAGARTHVDRLLGAIFPLHAGAVDEEAIPERDVELAEGETRTFDVTVARPPSGSLHGVVTVNGQPGKGVRAVLRPVAGEAPGAGGLAVRGDCDELGRLSIEDVPAGTYTLALHGSTRQELWRESLVVTPGARADLQVDLRAGGLRGRVRSTDGAREQDLRGFVWLLPGADAAPDDIYAFRRSHRVHRLRVKDAVFADAALTPGPAIVVVEIEGRPRAVTTTDVPAGGVRDLELTVGTNR